MSLRARLTLLSTSIVGGILLIFGMAVYISVSVTLTNQVDSTLTRAASQIIQNARSDRLSLSLPELTTQIAQEIDHKNFSRALKLIQEGLDRDPENQELFQLLLLLQERDNEQ